MKKIILAIALLGAITAKSQTLDTSSVKGFVVVRIATPFKVNWNDTTKAYFLAVSLASDNLKDAAVFNYGLMSAKGKYLYNGSVNCNGADYKNWDGNSEFPFTFVANKLNINVQ